MTSIAAPATPSTSLATPQPTAPAPLDQGLTGTFATMTRLPFTKPHRLYFGEHQGSFPSQQAAIDAARELSAGDAPGVVVTSHGPWQDEFHFTPDDRFVEDTDFNVYTVLDVTGPRITNPVVGWKPWNTSTQPYHHGTPSGVFGLRTWRSADINPQFQDLLVIDGDETVTVKERRS